MQQVCHGIVQRRAGAQAVQKDNGDVYPGGSSRVAHKGEHKDGGAEQRERDEGGKPERTGSADVQSADCQAAQTEADVGRDQGGPGDGRRQAAHGEGKDGGVEEDGPAGGHEAELREARKQDAAGFEHGEGDDRVAGAGLDGKEDGEGNEREEDGEGLDGAREAVEEEDDCDGQACCASVVETCEFLEGRLVLGALALDGERRDAQADAQAGDSRQGSLGSEEQSLPGVSFELQGARGCL